MAQIRSLTKWCIKRAENASDGRGFYPEYRRSPRDQFRRESAVHSLRTPDWQLAPYIDDVSELGLPFHGALPPSVVSGFAAFSTQCHRPYVTHTFLVLARHVESLWYVVLTYRCLICIISDETASVFNAQIVTRMIMSRMNKRSLCICIYLSAKGE